jgi:hypothetical protein
MALDTYDEIELKRKLDKLDKIDELVEGLEETQEQIGDLLEALSQQQLVVSTNAVPRIITKEELAVLDACKAFGDGEFGTIEGTLPPEHYLLHNAKEHALVLAIWAMNKKQLVVNTNTVCAVQGKHCGDPNCTKFHGG